VVGGGEAPFGAAYARFVTETCIGAKDELVDESAAVRQAASQFWKKARSCTQIGYKNRNSQKNASGISCPGHYSPIRRFADSPIR
jgi:hypothetical protein